MVVLPIDPLQGRKRRGSAIAVGGVSKQKAARTDDATSQGRHEGRAALMMERGGRGRHGRRCRCRRTARGRVGSIVSVDTAASIGTRGESHGGSRGANGRSIRNPSVKCCCHRRSTSSAGRRDGGIQCAVHAGVGTTKAAAIANVLVRRVPLMSGGAVFGIHTCSSNKATARFVKLVKGTDALLPNEGRFAAAGIAAADTGPIPTVQLGRASVGPAAVDRPTTSSRAAGGGRRRPRRGGRGRVGVPFKIVGGHLFCACVFFWCVYLLCVPCLQCNVPTPDNPQRQSTTMDVNQGCLMGLVQVNLFLFLGTVFNSQ